MSGAPLSGGTEFTTPGLRRPESAGQPAIPADAHIRLASFEHNGGTRILRRGYSFTDGIDPQTGTLLGGLFFIAFMKNPAQFIRLQQAWPPTPSTSTSTTPAAPSSPARPAFAPASTGATACSPDRSDGRLRGSDQAEPRGA